jgi:hypothetical protein
MLWCHLLLTLTLLTPICLSWLVLLTYLLPGEHRHSSTRRLRLFPLRGRIEACPPLFYQEGRVSVGGCPSLCLRRGSEDADSTTSDGPTHPTAGGCFPLHCHCGDHGGCSHFGRAAPNGWGDASLFAATEAVAAAEAEDTAAELITCAAPLRVMAPAPTSPEEDASRSSEIPAKGVSVAATSEGAATPVGVETELVTSAAPR